MRNSTEEILQSLIDSIGTISEVKAIGISGSKEPLPKAGEGDIDIFIYCDKLPSLKQRQDVMKKHNDLLRDAKVNVFEGGHWGAGDFGLINGVETWLMYFTVDETKQDIEAILRGEYPDKLDNYYYPVGRCAMLRNLSILYDGNNFLAELKERLYEYPKDLADILIKYHLEELEDREDLERALVRKDVFFYHFALDISIDHFLQALFAMNRTFFPSRKRTTQYIEKFSVKPKNCNERLHEVVKLGGYPEGIDKSFSLLCDLIKELNELGLTL